VVGRKLIWQRSLAFAGCGGWMNDFFMVHLFIDGTDDTV
jgi:hypothetical protein